MAILVITEYSNLGLNDHAPIPDEPAVAEQIVTYSTAAASDVWHDQTRFIRIKPTAACNVQFGASPVATAAMQPLAADVEYFRAVRAGHKLSVYDGSS